MNPDKINFVAGRSFEEYERGKVGFWRKEKRRNDEKKMEF